MLEDCYNEEMGKSLGLLKEIRRKKEENALLAKEFKAKEEKVIIIKKKMQQLEEKMQKKIEGFNEKLKDEKTKSKMLEDIVEKMKLA